MYKYMAAEYGFGPEQVDVLAYLELCAYLGAITPDHKIGRMPLKEYRRYVRTDRDRDILKRVHGKEWL